jgi:hypothetical protein
MKHSDYFKVLGLGLLAWSLLLASCSKKDEIAFRGTVVDAKICTQSMAQPSFGYLVNLDSPDSIGHSYTTPTGVTFPNVVILYEPDRLIYKDDKIKGSFYFDDKYPRANCTVQWHDIDDIPIGVFTSLTVVD